MTWVAESDRKRTRMAAHGAPTDSRTEKKGQEPGHCIKKPCRDQRNCLPSDKLASKDRRETNKEGAWLGREKGRRKACGRQKMQRARGTHSVQLLASLVYLEIELSSWILLLASTITY